MNLPLILGAIVILVVVIAAAYYFTHHKAATLAEPSAISNSVTVTPAPVVTPVVVVAPAPTSQLPAVVKTLSGFSYADCDGAYQLTSTTSGSMFYSKINAAGAPRTVEVTGNQLYCSNGPTPFGVRTLGAGSAVSFA